tara:strand:+ start:4582 stop:4905 length:324 start_codon:yes stop_codon:yes gene_type:complete
VFNEHFSLHRINERQHAEEGRMSKQDTFNNEALRELMVRHGLKQEHVAALAGCSVDTVKGWLVSPDSTRFRAVREPILISIRRAIELGEHYKLKDAKHTAPKKAPNK